MSARMLDLLIRQWPGETHLTAEETAKVLKLNPYTVRERMREGSLPGAEKKEGIWKMPLPDLAEILEPTPRAPQVRRPPVVAGSTHRRRAVVMNFRCDQFWAQVARVLGDIETANTLDARAQAEYDEKVRIYLLERAARRRARLMETAAHPGRPRVGEEDPPDL